MRAAAAGFVIGVIWLQRQASLPDSMILWLLAAALIVLAAMLRWRRPNWLATSFRTPVLLVSGMLFGLLWSSLFALHNLRHELPRELEGRDLTLTGTVSSLPYSFDNGVRFQFAVESARFEGMTIDGIPSKLALSWYGGWGSRDAKPVPEVRPGERWRLNVRLKRPHGNTNPHGFDYEGWLLEQNIRATGYVRQEAHSPLPNERLDVFVPGFGNAVERTRGWLRDRILAALPDKRYAGVIVALVIGDQRAIPQADWDVFNRTGISHLVSISGLHITMIAGLFATAVSALWRRSFFIGVQLPLLLPAQKAAAMAGACVAFLYVLLAGFGVPAQRTLYMLSVVAAALWFGRIALVSHVLCAALFATILLDPWAVLWPGFWLSFGAVAAILYATTGRVGLENRSDLTIRQRVAVVLKSATRTQVAVTLGLVPLTMLLFGQVSLIGPLANAIAIPLVGLLVTPLALIGSMLPPPLSAWILGCAHSAMEALSSGLEWMSSSSLAVWSVPVPSAAVFGFALIGTIWMLAPRGWPARWLGMAAWLPLVLNAPAHPAEGEMWVTAFDVGQGSAVLVETHRRRLLFDAGPAYSAETDGGNRVILPYLKARGIFALDGMVVSHNDSDHSGGALTIMKETRIAWVASSLSVDSPIRQSAKEHIRCQAGQAWSWDGVRFEMLHPSPASYASTKWKPNARSCVLKATAGEHSMLLTGDIEALQEEHLIGGMPEKLPSTVLLVPHHGSMSSSSLPFLHAVMPQVAVFQVGYRNRFGHPRPEVYRRYQDTGIERVRTDESGAVTFRFGNSVQVSHYRKEEARYWHRH